MKVIEDVIKNLKQATQSTIIDKAEVSEAIDDLELAITLIDSDIDDAREEGRDDGIQIGKESAKSEADGRVREIQEDMDGLQERLKYALPVVSILDACKVPILQRMFQNLSVEQLEEVENFARSTVKHPAKYIEYIHEN